MKKKLQNILVFTLSLVFIFITLEIVFRCLSISHNHPWNPGTVEQSKELGWKTIADFSHQGTWEEIGTVHYSTTYDGFRKFGDTATQKIKILVIGDSFTQAVNVSDEDTYYHYLQNQSSSIEVFAYGCGSYGTLQEFMILDKYLAVIKPDLVLWQFCPNDIYNNHYQLEPRIFGSPRPYLINHEIVYFKPSWIKLLAKKSKLLKFVDNKIHRMLVKKLNDPSIINDTSFVNAVNTTQEIIGMIKERIGNTPFVGFSVGTRHQQFFKAACQKSNLGFIDYVPAKISAARKKGIKINDMPHDGHWNETGHAIAGLAIWTYLKDKISK